ncbi:ribosome assembly RNA-binding protein YhbY [Vulgatibacter incomptus]|uniref:RNA binding protein n=1 Tax=Vulgatibacter incomptus TaxID=1391653 RepID=A0A0K1P8B4_9BACT|nr:ribosome assembly RNA-binding protein YhbY [Vulgatibacter incomptus]AKU89755.1 RNA binding protein [Vulgatibacter incomptus]
MTLAGKDRRALRALGHHLEPVIQLGQRGITAALVEASNDALADHELIKVRVLEACPLDRHEAAEQLAQETGSELAQVLGRTFLLYKRNPESPKIAIGTPPKAALHGHVGGEGDRPAARKPKRAITQGAADEGAPGRAAKKEPAGKRRSGTGAALPPRRHR